MLLNKLIVYNTDAIRVMPKEVKAKNSKVLVQEILMWGTYSHEDAIGILEVVKQHFIQLALTEQEKKIKV